MHSDVYNSCSDIMCFSAGAKEEIVHLLAQKQAINTDDDNENNESYLFLRGTFTRHTTRKRQQARRAGRLDYLQEGLLKPLHQINYSARFHSRITTICCISQEASKRKEDVFNCRFDPCRCHSNGSGTQSDESTMDSAAAVPAP